MLWLEVWATDSSGSRYHLPVILKGFDGEEYTIADSSAIAYRDIGDIMGIDDFLGLSRDGTIPDGARIFRHPYFNPNGEMTICQWYTQDNELVDYRFGPGETKNEQYLWVLPHDLKIGKVAIEATMYYSLVPSSIGSYFDLPSSEYESIIVSTAAINILVK